MWTEFTRPTTPYDVGLGRFVDDHKANFIGKKALMSASREPRLHGIKCPSGEPLIAGKIEHGGKRIGIVTAGALSPYLEFGIGYGLFDTSVYQPDMKVRVGCRDGQLHEAELVETPFYDREAEIPRGKLVDIPTRP